MLNKKAWLDILYYDIGKQQYDFDLAGSFKINDKVVFTKWKKYSEVIFPVDYNEDYKIEYINQRQILPNELVLDLEEKEKLNEVLDRIKKIGNFKIYIFDTHSRGYHIHIFFNHSFNNNPAFSLFSNEQIKKFLIYYFQTDFMKCYDKSLIALEYSKHFKSGKIITEVDYGDNKK